MAAKRYELSEVQWQRIAPLLVGKVGYPGRSGVDNRLFVNGVLWVLRSGAHWDDLLERYGEWKTLHKRFSRGFSRRIQHDYDRVLYRQRHRIENMFARLRDWRRIHTRYDRCAHTFLSAIAVAAAFVFWL